MQTNRHIPETQQRHECVPQRLVPKPTTWNQPVERPWLIIGLSLAMAAALIWFKAWLGA